MFVELIIVMEAELRSYVSDYKQDQIQMINLKITILTRLPSQSFHNRTHHPTPHPLLRVKLKYYFVGRRIDTQQKRRRTHN